MATSNPLPFQYAARWPMLTTEFDRGLVRVMEDRDRQLEDYIGQLQSVLGWEDVARSVSVGTTGSAAFVNWPTGGPMTSTINKARSDTDLIVSLGVSFYVSTAGVAVDFGVNIDGVDFLVIDAAHNTVSQHQGRAAHLKIPGIGGGPHLVTLRARTSGANLNCDANDTQSWSIRERFS